MKEQPLPLLMIGFLTSDQFVPADYDGNTDLAIIRNVSGAIHWWYLQSSNSTAAQIAFGTTATDKTAQGDYDGDGKTDIAIWRSSATVGACALWVQCSISGAFAVPFGQVNISRSLITILNKNIFCGLQTVILHENKNMM